MQELSAHVGHYPGNRTENDHDRGQGQYPDETDSRSNKNQPGLVRQSYSDKEQKGLGDSHELTKGTVAPISTARHFDRIPLRQRTVAAVGTVRHVNIRPRRLSTLTSNNKETSLEIDSHVDMCCVVKEVQVIYDYDRPVTVSDYDPQLGSRDFKTVLAVLEYTHPLNGHIYHIFIHQAIHIPNLDHHLLCPMQCRVNDIIINDVPKFLMKTPTHDSHYIVSQDINNPLNPLVLPL